jgi:hypothetical protein
MLFHRILITTGGWVIDYINHFWPHKTQNNNKRKMIDFMMITHFHQDHIGSIYTDANPIKQAKGVRGNYTRTGIVEVGDEFDFHTIIDRGYPKYDFPFNLEQEWESAPFQNYLNFIRSSIDTRGTIVEKFQVGNYTQIGLRKKKVDSFGHFAVRNIKANLEYSFATPEDRTVQKIDGKLLYPDNKRKSGYTYDENKVSTAIVIEYGKFRYYEGGDQEYHNNGDPKEDVNNQYDLDTVTPTAKVAGRVHVATLNHHGHGILSSFCSIINPKVMILQGWCSDQPPNHSIEMISQHMKDDTTITTTQKDIFATSIFNERLNELGNLRNLFKSTLGHVVVRVEPPATDPNDRITNQQYHVYVLDGSRQVHNYFGPYKVD